MPKAKVKNPADFIVSLNMNGLQGRMLSLPAPRNHKREILFIYGHHSTIERWWGVIQVLNDYGAVTVPDLPGFGGMESFYRLEKKPTIDNLADYLAAFIKMRYKRRRITIAALSFGFVVVTRMLQRYPDLAGRIDILASVVGFTHRDDFTFSRPRHFFYLTAAKLFSRPLPAALFKYIALNKPVLRLVYGRTHNAKHKFTTKDRQEKRRLMDFEIHLWHVNDVRTHMYTYVEFLDLDNCRQHVDLPVWHVSVKADNYFDNNRVEQHMRVVFRDFYELKSTLSNHAPSIIADKKEASTLLPAELRRLLREA